MTGWLQWELPPEAGGSGCRRKICSRGTSHPQAPVCSAFAPRGKTKRPKGLLCFQHLAPSAHLYSGIEQWAWILQLCSAYTCTPHTPNVLLLPKAGYWAGIEVGKAGRNQSVPDIDWTLSSAFYSNSEGDTKQVLGVTGMHLQHPGRTGGERHLVLPTFAPYCHWVASWPHFAFPVGGWSPLITPCLQRTALWGNLLWDPLGPGLHFSLIYHMGLRAMHIVNWCVSRNAGGRSYKRVMMSYHSLSLVCLES